VRRLARNLLLVCRSGLPHAKSPSSEKGIFDEVAFPVPALVIADDTLSVSPSGNDGDNFCASQGSAQVVGIITNIAEHVSHPLSIRPAIGVQLVP